MVGIEGVLWECIQKCHHGSYNLVKPNSRTFQEQKIVFKDQV